MISKQGDIQAPTYTGMSKQYFNPFSAISTQSSAPDVLLSTEQYFLACTYTFLKF